MVAWFRMSTVAPGTTKPLESRTVPVTLADATVCAIAGGAVAHTHTNASHAARVRSSDHMKHLENARNSRGPNASQRTDQSAGGSPQIAFVERGVRLGEGAIRDDGRERSRRVSSRPARREVRKRLRSPAPAATRRGRLTAKRVPRPSRCRRSASCMYGRLPWCGASGTPDREAAQGSTPPRRRAPRFLAPSDSTARKAPRQDPQPGSRARCTR